MASSIHLAYQRIIPELGSDCAICRDPFDDINPPYSHLLYGKEGKPVVENERFKYCSPTHRECLLNWHQKGSNSLEGRCIVCNQKVGTSPLYTTRQKIVQWALKWGSSPAKLLTTGVVFLAATPVIYYFQLGNAPLVVVSCLGIIHVSAALCVCGHQMGQEYGNEILG